MVKTTVLILRLEHKIFFIVVKIGYKIFSSFLFKHKGTIILKREL